MVLVERWRAAGPAAGTEAGGSALEPEAQNREGKIEIMCTLNSQSLLSYFLQGHTSPKSTIVQGPSVQMPETVGGLPHSNHHIVYECGFFCLCVCMRIT